VASQPIVQVLSERQLARVHSEALVELIQQAAQLALGVALAAADSLEAIAPATCCRIARQLDLEFPCYGGARRLGLILEEIGLDRAL
jgi:hypothetical protein